MAHRGDRGQRERNERGDVDRPCAGGLVLITLILVAAVANLNLAVANVALPDIGKAFDASQTALNLVAVGYSLGLAASVLYFGAVGDRYGRKLLLVLGTLLAIPAALLAALAPSVEVLFVARLLGGLAAGMAFPTTLALITALWSGPARTKSIALWSALGGAISALGPLISGALLERFDWGSVFVITLPLAVLALVLAILFVPSHVNETSDPVDNLGRDLSVVLVAALVLAINFAAVPNEGALALGLGDRRRGHHRLPDPAARARSTALRPQRRRAPDVLGRGLRRADRVRDADGGDVRRPAVPPERARLLDLEAGAAILPAAVLMVLCAPRSAKLIETRGARFTLLTGYAFCLLGFIAMLLLWNDGIAYWKVGLGYALIGAGVGFAGTPASHSLTGSVPVVARRHGVGNRRSPARPRRSDHAVDPRRPAHRGLRLCRGGRDRSSSEPAADLRQRREPAPEVLRRRGADRRAVPQYADAITAGAKSSFLDGADWAYAAGSSRS